MTDWQTHAEQLADGLVDRGAIRTAPWRAAFATVPRHLFVPRFYAMDEFNQPRNLVDATGPGWLEAIYQDQVLITHYEVLGEMPDGQEVRGATSSASMPHVVAVMLDRLDVRDRHRVLEIGTGTGYHAGLLAARVGAENVTSIEVDELSAAEAARHLAVAGYRPNLVIGDGAAGVPDRAPYDRIIATCAISRIPTAWLSQLAPGGRIVAPLTFGSALAVLDRTDDGGGSGRLDPELVSFMAMRSTGHRPAPVTIHRPDGVPHRSLTAVDPQLLNPFSEAFDLQVWLSLHLPSAASIALTCTDDGVADGIIVTSVDSYVDVSYQPAQAGMWPVNQLGAHRLWDTVEVAYAAYEQQGKPTRDRLGITVNPDGDQYLWLDDPDGPYSWPMPL